MKYETVKEAAERLGVTARTVQKWAAAGKIPGAMKAGRDWQIPVQKEEGAKKCTRRKHIPMPLLNSAFPLGQCTRYIEKMEDEVRMMHYGIRQRGSMPFPTLLVTRLP